MNDYSNFEQKAKELRKKVVELAYQRKEGHIGGAFSIAEIMVALYDSVLKDEDKFILSKGHACLPLFILLREKGYNPKVAGHPEIDPANGIWCTTGSLGHGFPIGLGMALARKIKNSHGKIYVMVGDAECQEGTIWESALLGAHHKLDNLVLIIDNNEKQTLGRTSDILSLGDIERKFSAFDWSVSNINGHSFPQIFGALSKETPGKPHVIIANTVKGKGVKFMEEDYSGWHNAVPNEQQLREILEELR